MFKNEGGKVKGRLNNVQKTDYLVREGVPNWVPIFFSGSLCILYKANQCNKESNGFLHWFVTWNFFLCQSFTEWECLMWLRKYHCVHCFFIFQYALKYRVPFISAKNYRTKLVPTFLEFSRCFSIFEIF